LTNTTTGPHATWLLPVGDFLKKDSAAITPKSRRNLT
jgi:hypothetical protein